uniref:WGS project CBMI000000000 data, contig CS3069_c004354 n=1 Tax=Fusarium clavum TaxID=2594811 RepID=A0A090MKF9_9HYPO|nr:unnamed protein product [Fusarium clavum]
MEPNDVPTDSRQTQLCLIAWIFTGMAILTVTTKLFTTVIIFQRPGWDDLLILLSLVGSIVASALVQASADLGLGRHTAAVASEPGGIEKMVRTKILQVIGYPFNIIAYSLPNVAILILIERLVGRTKNTSLWFLRVVVAIQIFLALISVVIIFAQCRPTRMLWDQEAKGECWSPDVFNHSSYVVSSFTVLTDLVLAIVPIHAFWKTTTQETGQAGDHFHFGTDIPFGYFYYYQGDLLEHVQRSNGPVIQRRDVDYLGLGRTKRRHHGCECPNSEAPYSSLQG